MHQVKLSSIKQALANQNSKEKNKQKGRKK
jgi:hypothetical protein